MTEKKIITEFLHPPIPSNFFDWCAYFEDYEEGGSCGYGPTEDKAIQALRDQDNE